MYMYCTVYLCVSLGSGFWILYDVFKGQSSVEHHGLLTGDHLTIDRVVEVSHLKLNLKKKRILNF